MSKTKADLLNTLSQGPRTDLSNSFSKSSGVALLLFETPQGLELLFIQRASNPRDNWSGQIAFPGGKQDPEDATLLDACLREVQEEVGLEVSAEALLGCLDDLQARKKGNVLDFYVRPFVFFLAERPVLFSCDSEVADAFWVPVSYLLSAENQTTYEFFGEGLRLSLPAIQLPAGQILWGLSYMMVKNFLAKCI